MLSALGVIWSFVKALPTLVRLYDKIVYLFGDNLEKVEADLQAQVELVKKSREPGLTLEQRREIRREALKLGAGMFGRID